MQSTNEGVIVRAMKFCHTRERGYPGLDSRLRGNDMVWKGEPFLPSHDAAGRDTCRHKYLNLTV